jgi:hypothetical protein
MAVAIIGQAGLMVCAVSLDFYAEITTGLPKSGLLRWHRGEIAGFL